MYLCMYVYIYACICDTPELTHTRNYNCYYTPCYASPINYHIKKYIQTHRLTDTQGKKCFVKGRILQNRGYVSIRAGYNDAGNSRVVETLYLVISCEPQTHTSNDSVGMWVGLFCFLMFCFVDFVGRVWRRFFWGVFIYFLNF